MNIHQKIVACGSFRIPIQLLRIMKLTMLIMTLFLLQVSASTKAQITLNEKRATLQKVLKSISKQSGYDLIYQDEDLKNTSPVSIKVDNASLEKTLQICFEGQPLMYELSDKTVKIRKKEASSFLEHLVDRWASIDITGRVVDHENDPLPGATIKVKATGKSVSTDARGNFMLKNIEEGAVLVVSYTGYMTREIKAVKDMGSIVLEVSLSKLDEIQIIAYGTTTQRLSTGSVVKVKSDQIEKSPASNPILSLEGRVAGVSITENSGVAGSSYSINIRGQNSISAGQLPLYIVDGVPFDGKAVEQSSGGSALLPPSVVGFNGFNPLNVLTPGMIESIEILKDADATAIYGSRAANGVVVITTKKGKAGATKVDADIYSGVSSISRTLPMLNADQYLDMRKKAFANDNITPTAVNAPDLISFTPGWDTDFQKYFLNTGHFTNVAVNLSGGNEFTQFLVSGSYRYESPLFSGNFSDKIAHAKFNIQHSSKNERFKINASANYATDNNTIPAFDLFRVYNMAPNLPLYNSTGNLAWYTGFTNPVSYVINPLIQKSQDLLSNLTLSYRIATGLTFKVDAGYHNTQVQNLSPTFIRSKDPSSASSATGSVAANFTNIELYNIEPQLNYTKKIGKGVLLGLAGSTYQYNSSIQPIFYSGTFVSDALYQNVGSLTITGSSSAFNERKYFSLFGRVNYTWDNKYIINANYRRDGSSAFAPDNRYGNFGSIGAAWVISEEKFLKDRYEWLSFLKVRSNYGSIGNDQIPAYGYLSYYSSSNPYAGSSTLNPVRLQNNNNFSWEITKKLDISSDIGFFKDRILLSASIYRNLTSNMLLTQVPLAAQTGFASYVGNVPDIKVENKGIELELNTVNIRKKGFSWQTSFNFSVNRNKVVSFPGLSSSAFATGNISRNFPTSGYLVGHPINLLFGYQLTGFNNGVATVLDANGDGKISPGLNGNGKGDWVPLGTSDPKYYGGLSNTFNYKQFQFDFLFQFVKKESYNIYRGAVTAPGNNVNQPKDILNYPVTYSSTAGSAAASAFVNYFAQSSATVSDASYIRLKNVSLTYRLPTSLVNHWHMQNAGVFVRAQNLLTFTSYKGFDPENFGATLPLYRMVTIGLQTSF